MVRGAPSCPRIVLRPCGWPAGCEAGLHPLQLTRREPQTPPSPGPPAASPPENSEGAGHRGLGGPSITQTTIFPSHPQTSDTASVVASPVCHLSLWPHFLFQRINRLELSEMATNLPAVPLPTTRMWPSPLGSSVLGVKERKSPVPQPD